MKFRFTEKEIQEMLEQFNALDTDGKDMLSEETIDNYVKTLDVNTVFAQLAFRLFDFDNDNSLTFAEYALFLKGIKLLKSNPKEFHQLVFESVDVDDNGLLDSSEFDLYIKLLGFDETSRESRAFIKALDKDGKGTISFDELYNGLIIPLTEKTQ